MMAHIPTCRETYETFPDHLRWDDDETHAEAIDGFLFRDAPVSGELNRRLDWLIRARVSGPDAEGQLQLLARWLGSLGPDDRARATLTLLARWHWLWNLGALEDPDDDEDESSLAGLVHWVADDLERLTLVSSWPPHLEGISPDLLADLIRWAASGLLDRASLLNRERLISLARRTLQTQRPTARLIEALELLLAAEQRPQSRTQPDAAHNQAELKALLQRQGEVNDADILERRARAHTDQLLADLEHHLEADEPLAYELDDALRADGPFRAVVIHRLFSTLLSRRVRAPEVAGDPLERAVVALLRRLLVHPVEMSTDQWERLLANPLVFRLDGLCRGAIHQLKAQDIQADPAIRAALVAARTALLARQQSSQIAPADQNAADALSGVI